MVMRKGFSFQGIVAKIPIIKKSSLQTRKFKKKVFKK
ncbi:MAG: hypothetical protein ACJA1B_001438 [Polaribacter sp.]|jgi:hypothetical protein